LGFESRQLRGVPINDFAPKKNFQRNFSHAALRGPPRSLRSIINPEEVSIARRMRKAITQELRPKTPIEWILVNEIVNAQLSAMRYGTSGHTREASACPLQPSTAGVSLSLRSEARRIAPAAPAITEGISRSSDVTVLVRASARGHIAGLAEYPDAWHERITRHPNCVRRDVSQETVFWTIRKGLRMRKVRPVIGCVEVMRAMHSRRRTLVFVGSRRAERTGF
jgi:hypothetical protein